MGHLAWSGRPPLPWNMQWPDHGLMGLFISVSGRTCPHDSTLQIGKDFAHVQDFRLRFKPWSSESSVSSLKRGFPSLKSHWGEHVTLASPVWKSWAPCSCREPFHICRESRSLEGGLGHPKHGVSESESGEHRGWAWKRVIGEQEDAGGCPGQVSVCHLPHGGANGSIKRLIYSPRSTTQTAASFYLTGPSTLVFVAFLQA